MIITNKTNLEKDLAEALLMNSNGQLSHEEANALANQGVMSLNFLNKNFGFSELDRYAKQILNALEYNKLK